jgi:signal transduction histidine kinase
MPDSSPLLRAVHLAARKLASNADFDGVLRDVLAICVEAVGASGGTIYLHDRPQRKLQFRHVLPEEVAQAIQFSDMPDDQGVAGRVFRTRRTELSEFDASEPVGEIGKRTGVIVHNMVTVPLMMESEEPIGVVQLVNKLTGPFRDEDALVLDTVSAVATMAYLNTRLLDESTRASQLLGMGKVGHDIKNLACALEANVSWSDETMRALRTEVELMDPDSRVFPYIEDIDSMFRALNLSIERIQRYATLMSDLSAGNTLTPVMRPAPLAETVRLAAAYLESEGRVRRVRFEYDLQEDAPLFIHDDMYVFRIVQNLVSNALKAVDETRRGPAGSSGIARVKVRYRFDGAHHVLEVEDDGPGMTRETADRILAGAARSIWSNSTGSGWGTKIVLELTKTHAGEVEIDSEPGKGSTFRIRFPHG